MFRRPCSGCGNSLQRQRGNLKPLHRRKRPWKAILLPVGRRIRSNASVQVKRVNVSVGATPLGRRPRRTKSVGTSAPSATASRAWPMPSIRHRSDRPTTSRRASRAASITPCSPGRMRTGSVTIPITCCTSIEARDKSLLASLDGRIGLGPEEPERRPERLGQANQRFQTGRVVPDQLHAAVQEHEDPKGPNFTVTAHAAGSMPPPAQPTASGGVEN